MSFSFKGKNYTVEDKSDNTNDIVQVSTPKPAVPAPVEQAPAAVQKTNKVVVPEDTTEEGELKAPEVITPEVVPEDTTEVAPAKATKEQIDSLKGMSEADNMDNRGGRRIKTAKKNQQEGGRRRAKKVKSMKKMSKKELIKMVKSMK